ncbi:hypothetical protein FRC12_021837 [Ceratobasidium sp. 428]|nr:hypothetical protein FRC12_021837 [Ceratobasidium sp. 428]
MVASPLAFFVGLGGFALASLVAASEAPKSTSDPCAAIAGKFFLGPSEARRCLKSFPYNATLANNVLEVVTKVTPFFTYEDWQKKTPAPFTEASSNLAVEFARIRDNTRRNKYKTDYGFNRDVYNVISRLDDGHTRKILPFLDSNSKFIIHLMPVWLPACYWAIFQNVAPAPLVALEKDGSQDIYIAPNAAELANSLGRAYTDYYTKELGFNYTKYAGAKVLKINGIDAWMYVELQTAVLELILLAHR